MVRLLERALARRLVVPLEVVARLVVGHAVHAEEGRLPSPDAPLALLEDGARGLVAVRARVLADRFALGVVLDPVDAAVLVDGAYQSLLSSVLLRA